MLVSVHSHAAAKTAHDRIIHHLIIEDKLNQKAKLALCLWLEILEHYIDGKLTYTEARKLLITLHKKTEKLLSKRTITHLSYVIGQ